MKDAIVYLLASTDVHGRFVPYDFPLDSEATDGALTYLATTIREFRKTHKQVILMDCGDACQSNLCEQLIDEPENPMIAAMNYMGYELWTLGNHEYNFTLQQRQSLVDQFHGTTLSGNVFRKGEKESYLPSRVLLERDGIRIGVIGMTTPLILGFEKDTGNLKDFDVYNPAALLHKEIRTLKEAGAAAVVGLIHEGMEEENDIYGSGLRDLAGKFPEFDVIIGGHSHKLTECESENGVLLCTPGAFGRGLSCVTLRFCKTENGTQLTEKSAGFIPCGRTEDPKLAKMMEPHRQKLRGIANHPIGKLLHTELNSRNPMTGRSEYYFRSSGVLNLFATACMYYSGADCMFLGTDNPDPHMETGDIRWKDIAANYTYTSGDVNVYEFTGAMLKQLLEWCAAFYQTTDKEGVLPAIVPERLQQKYTTFFSAYGIRYVIDTAQTAGHRIHGLELLKKDEKKTPVFDENGKPAAIPITDDTRLSVGANKYYMNKWFSQWKCVDGELPRILFRSWDSYGENGTVRMLTRRYIEEACGGTVDGRRYQYPTWNLMENLQ